MGKYLKVIKHLQIDGSYAKTYRLNIRRLHVLAFTTWDGERRMEVSIDPKAQGN